MQVIYDLEKMPSNMSGPISLTIGNFDGIHIGHTHLLEKVKKKATLKGTSIAISFTNHTSEVLSQFPHKKLLSLDHKIKLFKKNKIDILLLFTFTSEFANLSFIDFIKLLKNRFSFQYMLLGQGATFGKNNSASSHSMQKAACQNDFELIFIQKILEKENEPISSTIIRKAISSNNLNKAQQLLGRKFSLYIEGTNAREMGSETSIKFYLDKSLILPPSGYYNVEIFLSKKSILPVLALLENNAITIYSSNDDCILLKEEVLSFMLTFKSPVNTTKQRDNDD
jgi:riboflavin kinase / FMN adenylyltransferase